MTTMGRSNAQSTQRYPLTAILGNETKVRLLRELSRHGGQLSAPDLVRRAGLAKAGVWAGLASLVEMDLVSVAGAGRARLYSMRADHPLHDALNNLFAAEERRFEAVLNAIREAAAGCGSGVKAVWLYGSVARGEDRPGSDLDIAVVAAENDLTNVSDAMRDALYSAGMKLGFKPSVVGIGPSDIARLARERDPWWVKLVRDAFVLLGPSPGSLAKPPRSAGKAGRRRAAA
jgi:predicted nucleotidyltransferase